MSHIEDSNRPIRFDRYELRPETRELVGPDGRVHLEPRTFLLLSYLIAQRHRVVPKEELMQEVWKTVHISASVLPRAVMKLRKELSDDDDEGRLIRTYHRVGYRFVAEIAEPTPVSLPVATAVAPARPVAACVPTEPKASDVRRLAFLPFRNATGDAALSWVELGLATIAQRALDAVPGLSVITMRDVILALGLQLNSNDAALQARNIAQDQGVQDVLTVSVEAAGSGYRMVWGPAASRSSLPRGELSGSSLTEMALDMSRRLGSALQRHDPARAAEQTPVFDAADTFLNEAYARAMQARETEAYEQALTLLRICLDVVPHPLRIDIDHSILLNRWVHADAMTVGTRALARARAEGTPRDEIEVLLSLAHFELSRFQYDSVETRLNQAQALLQDLDAPDLRVIYLIRRALWCALTSSPSAQEATAEALAHATAIGAQRHQAHALKSLATLKLYGGRADEAVTLYQACADLYLKLGTQIGHWGAMCDVSRSLAASGHVNSALQTLVSDDAFKAKASNMGAMVRYARIQAQLLAGQGEQARVELDRMTERQPTNQTDPPVYRAIAAASVHFFEGNHARAEAVLGEFREAALSNDDFTLLFPWFFALPLRQADWARAESELALFVASKYARRMPQYQELVERYRAQLAYARGDRTTASVHLQQAMAYAVSLENVYEAGHFPTGLDAIWLAAERGETDRVADMVRALSPWLSETRVGLATMARYRYALGDYHGAIDAQKQCVARCSPHAAIVHGALLEGYHSAARHGATQTLPDMGQLPTVL